MDDKSKEPNLILKIANKVYHIYKRNLKHTCYKCHMKTKRYISYHYVCREYGPY